MILSKIDPFVASVALFHIHSITGKDRKEIIEFAKNIIDGSMVSSDWKKNLRRTYLKTKYDYLYFKMDKSRVMHLPQIKNDLYFFEMEDSPLLFKMFAMSEKFHLALKIDELREICQLVPDAATAIHKSNVSLLHFASSLFPIRDSDEVPFEAIQVLLKKNRQKKDEIVKVIDHLMESISSTLKIMKETKTVSSDVHIFITERIKASECLVKTFLENLKYKSDDVIKLPVSESKKIFAPLFGSEKVGIRMSELKKMITYFSKQLVSELGHRGFLDKIESSPKVQNAITQFVKIFVVVLVDYMKRKNDRATQEALTLYVKIFVIVFIDYMKNENNKSDEKIVKMIRIGKVCLTLSRDEQDDMEYELEATENGNIKEEICSLSQKHIQEFIDKSEVGPMHLIDLLESWGETGSRMAGLIKSQVA